MAPEFADNVPELLLKARAARARAGLPKNGRPRNPAAAYSIQDSVMQSLGRAGGWKVGAASPDEEPLCAPLPDALIFESPLRIPSDRFTVLGLEAEIAFRIGRDLPPRGREYEREEVEEAIAAALPTIEIVDSRWEGWPDIPAMWHLADHQSNGALICGPESHDWRAVDLQRQPVRLTLNGRIIVEHVGGNKAGDPIRLLAWLANHAAARSGGLKQEDVVTTGSCTGLGFADPGSTVVAEFGDLGRAEVTFT